MRSPGFLRRLPHWRFREVPRPPLSRREASGLLAAFGGSVLLFATVVVLAEEFAGLPLLAPRPPTPGPGGLDAIWHLATMLPLVLALGDRRALYLGPLLALELDVDHVYGLVLPAPFGRPAHNLILFGALLLGLYRWGGRTPSLLASGAMLEHLAVDGGGFPLFAPLSAEMFSLSLYESLGLLALASLLIYGSLRPIAELRKPRRFGAWALPVIVVSLILVFVAPGFQGFTAL